MPFTSIFIDHGGNTIEPIQRIRVAGVTLSPGVRINRGTIIGGVDLTQFIGRDFEVETQKDILVITGIYDEHI